MRRWRGKNMGEGENYGSALHGNEDVVESNMVKMKKKRTKKRLKH